MDEDFGCREIRVLALCEKLMIDESEVELTNIEENEMGEDVVTFICPICDEVHKSRRFG